MTTYTLTGDVRDLIREPFSPGSLSVTVKASTPAIKDVAAKQLLLGPIPAALGQDGKFSIALPSSGPSGPMYQLHVEWVPVGARTTKTLTLGWFEMTANHDITDPGLIEIQPEVVNPQMVTSVATLVQEATVQANAVKAVVATNDGIMASAINTPGSQTETALSASIAAEVAPRVAAYIGTQPAVVDSAAAAAAPAVSAAVDAQFPAALVAHAAVLGVSVNRIVAAPLGTTPAVADGDVVFYYDTPGANYYVDFMSTTPGAAPAGWTQLWGAGNWTVQNVAEATGGKALVVGPAATGTVERVLTLDAVNADPHRADSEILFRFRSASVYLLSAFARGAGNGVGAGANGWRMGNNLTTGLRVSSYSNGGESGWASLTIESPLADAWYLMRARIEGASQKVKIWKDGTPEPAWMVSDTKANIPAAGAVGLALSRHATASHVHQIDWVAIATGGRTAVQS